MAARNAGARMAWRPARTGPLPRPRTPGAARYPRPACCGKPSSCASTAAKPGLPSRHTVRKLEQCEGRRTARGAEARQARPRSLSVPSLSPPDIPNTQSRPRSGLSACSRQRGRLNSRPRIVDMDGQAVELRWAYGSADLCYLRGLRCGFERPAGPLRASAAGARGDGWDYVVLEPLRGAAGRAVTAVPPGCQPWPGLADCTGCSGDPGTGLRSSESSRPR
jgi:hypothetical protein